MTLCRILSTSNPPRLFGGVAFTPILRIQKPLRNLGLSFHERNTFVGVLQAASRSQQELVWFTARQADSRSTRRGKASGWCFVSQLKSAGGLESDENHQSHTRRCGVRGIVRWYRRGS